jgi:hypothetical protein
MKAQVAVYDSHQKALEAIKVLSDHNFPMDKVSLLGKADVIGNHIHVKSMEDIKDAPALLGAGAGTIVGLLTGVGAFAIPGFGFLYGAGAVLGAIGGFDLGIIAGGIGTLLATIGIKKDKVVKVHEHLDAGKFLVIVQGTSEDIENAKRILHTHGTHHSMVNA